MVRELVPIGEHEHVEVSAEDTDSVWLMFVNMKDGDDDGPAAVGRFEIAMTSEEAIRMTQAINRTIEEAKRRFPKAARDGGK